MTSGMEFAQSRPTALTAQLYSFVLGGSGTGYGISNQRSGIC